jgi:hypothetical protein
MTLDNIYDVRFSREATVRHSNGMHYNAFQRNSYLVRVGFDTGEAVVVILPLNAAQQPESQWIGKALMAAFDAHHAGMEVIRQADD